MKERAGTRKPSRRTWEGDTITHYVDIETVTAVFKSHSDIVGYQPYTMRLPYTEAQWQRRLERLAAEKGSEK